MTAPTILTPEQVAQIKAAAYRRTPGQWIEQVCDSHEALRARTEAAETVIAEVRAAFAEMVEDGWNERELREVSRWGDVWDALDRAKGGPT